MIGLIDHSNYLAKELWITFYDIGNCFGSLWIEDCINALWKNGIQDNNYLVYLVNRKAHVTVKTLFGDTDPFISTGIVKQSTSLNKYSPSDICDEGKSFIFGSVEVKSSEFVDDIADPSYGKNDTALSNDVICDIQ